MAMNGNVVLFSKSIHVTISLIQVENVSWLLANAKKRRCLIGTFLKRQLGTVFSLQGINVPSNRAADHACIHLPVEGHAHVLNCVSVMIFSALTGGGHSDATLPSLLIFPYKVSVSH